MTTTVELTEQERANLAEMPEADRRILAAFRRAMADCDVPAHPPGKCPATPCPCSAAADAIEVRARELLDDPDAEPCIDCWVLLPLDPVWAATKCSGRCSRGSRAPGGIGMTVDGRAPFRPLTVPTVHH